MLDCFIFNSLYQGILKLIRQEILLCISYIFWKIIEYSVIFDCSNFLCNVIKVHNFLPWTTHKTWASFLHEDGQLSWRFYVFEQDMQLLYTDIGNISDDFISFNELCNFNTKVGNCPGELFLNEMCDFYRVNCFAFSRYPMTKIRAS